jgi:hypothetical protein
MSSHRSVRLTASFPEALNSRVETYANKMGISKSEAVRFLVEDQLNGQQLRDRYHVSFERLLEINEYVFESMIAQNEQQLTPEVRQQIFDGAAKSLMEKHPIYSEEHPQ